MSVLDGECRDRLLRLARASIRDALGEPCSLEAELGQAPPAGELLDPRGAFVSLKIDGRLRGCVGRVEASRPLWRTVTEVARGAAVSDPRFPPLTLDELTAARIEISSERGRRRARL